MSSKENEIFNAIENGTYKHAQQLCAKVLKKNPNDSFYKVLNNYILAQSGKTTEAIELSKPFLEDPPSDLRSLELLVELFNELGLYDESLQVFENAAKKHKTFDIMKTWFHFGIEQSNVRIIQKASMGMKNLSRLFKLWAAFSCYLVANLSDATMMEKTLFPKLGLKTIEQCEPLKNEQEIYIKVKLLQQTGGLQQIPDEILKFSKGNKLDLELQIILLDTFNKLEDWENLYKWSHIVLIDYKLDDFNTWKYLIKSLIKLSKDITKIIDDYQTRNSKLAKLELNVQLNQDLHDSVVEYLKFLGHKACAFPDIKSYFHKIDSEKLLSWLETQPHSINDDKGLIWNVNVMKFKALANPELFKSEKFINENIKLWNSSKHLLSSKSKTDYFNGDEFILFIIQSLLSIEFSTKNIILSIIILENTIIKDEHEFHLRLWLIQLYSLINCYTQARYHYNTLKIKNVQHDILDQFIISRLSTQFPNNEDLKISYQIYKSNEVETVHFNKIGFNQGSFNKLEKMIEFQKRLDTSILKNHEILQGLKIGRVLNDKEIINTYKKLKINDEVSDNRDFHILWNVGIDEELSFKDELLQNIPGESYIKVHKIFEDIINDKDITISDGLDTSDLSTMEFWSFELLTNLYNFIKTKDTDLLTEIKESYNEVPDLPKDLSWEINNGIITILETTKSIQSILSNSNQKINKKDLSDLKELNVSLLQKTRDDTILNKRQDIKNLIISLKSKLNDDEILSSLKINNGSKDKILEIIENSNNEAFKILRLL
ncbi:hypothetical protein BN7_2306 [Wickerhamomyces ciferrii]|uniref:Uncharacterized protein n=1 Tax=Wickerhamomyces ciferrii (strain ATCC 14091 / BCRC 22168 / CBS 111 / JCM 3599 / NBRC 0793 / NRRL Y-1031 F-60-10) TaxID=1206466 RepID=K0KKV6_WICCF|nr:uncharacterized protein BN7_2306 [Wickerhamomyces ciferrii]CCH42762.1 hypothetical protein BN7_2306 [Wickerhamomyces ciferrii]